MGRNVSVNQERVFWYLKNSVTCHSGIYILFLDSLCLQINETYAKNFFLKYNSFFQTVFGPSLTGFLPSPNLLNPLPVVEN